jgi:hypothetical protein
MTRTEAGQVIGTVGYMSPEHVKGDAADYRINCGPGGRSTRRVLPAPWIPDAFCAIVREPRLQVRTLSEGAMPMNRWFAILAFAVLLASIGRSATSTPPTQVVNVDDPTRHPYQEFADTSCTGPGDCFLPFPAITTGRTVIQHASCLFNLTAGVAVLSASLSGPDSNARNFLPVFVYGNSGGVAYQGINADTYLFYTVGQQPRIDVFSNTGGAVTNLQCNLTGYYN